MHLINICLVSCLLYCMSIVLPFFYMFVYCLNVTIFDAAKCIPILANKSHYITSHHTTHLQLVHYEKLLVPFQSLQHPFTFLEPVFLPESSSLIGQFTGSGHFSYVTDDSRLSNLHNYFSNK